MKRIVAVVLAIGALGAFPGAALAQGPPSWVPGPPDGSQGQAFHACNGPGQGFHAVFCRF
jgi:hypothetical protein